MYRSNLSNNCSPPRKNTVQCYIQTTLSDHHSLRQIKLLKNFHNRTQKFTGHAGEPKDSTVLTGGDLAVYAHNEDQQTSLLSLKFLKDRPGTCSRPLSSTTNRVGVIFCVLTSDTILDLQEALADQNVTHVKRFPMRGNPDLPSALHSSPKPLPYRRVKITLLSCQPI